jgi:hypothetical protein
MRWIVSDPMTEQRLKPLVGSSEVEIGLGDSPFREALTHREPCLLVLPSRTGKLLLAHINGPVPQPRLTQQAPDEHFGYQPSGFLGLSDEVAYLDEPEPPKKKRFW